MCCTCLDATGRLCFAGSHLLVEGLLLCNAVLPSWKLVDSGLALPAPLAFNLSGSNTSLLLLNCTVSTSCNNYTVYRIMKK